MTWFCKHYGSYRMWQDFLKNVKNLSACPIFVIGMHKTHGDTPREELIRRGFDYVLVVSLN